jgi:outer membrane protein OmpA-like peptidoglycan-associated protein
MKKISNFIILFIVLTASYSFLASEVNQDDAIKARTVFTGSKDSIYFEENSAEISDIYKAKLDLIAVFFKSNPTVTLLIHSYEHEFENSKTADKRSAIVKEYFEKAGVPSAKLFTKIHPTMLAQHEDAKFKPGEKEELRRVIVQIMH